MVPGFFDNLRDYSEIKLRILGRFLAPWAAKLGSMARRGNGVIWYVDGFAGPGRYDDGGEGSPLLGLRQAKQTLLEARAYRLACFFVEKTRGKWSALEELALPFRDAGINVRNELGEFSGLVAEIERATRGSPVLLFVDPFGISKLKYEQFRTMLGRRSPLDLILTFQHRAVYRLANVLPHLVTEAIGTHNWRDQWSQIADPALQTQYILDLFRENLLRDGGFLDVFFYPIRSSITAAPRYYLVFASRHYDAFELWNDEVATEETTLSRRSYDALARQATFLPVIDEETSVIKLINEIRDISRLKERFTRQDIVQDIVMGRVSNRLGQYHTKDIKRAVSSMVASGELRRQGARGKNIDQDYMYRGSR